MLAIALAAPAGASATSLTPGDVVVERDGNGGVEALTSAGTTVYLNEFEPRGGLAATLQLPTSASGSNKPLVDSGTSTSDGLLTLAGKGECLLLAGYDAALGREKISETKAKEVPRTVAVVNSKGEINTTTALENFANENNARSAASNDCKTLWVGGGGTKTTGGVVEAALGASTGTQMNEGDTNVRQVEVVNGQLYASADPTKSGALTIATVGSGLPTTKPQTFTNLSFEKAPEQPYAYSLLTLSPLGGTTPDTLYVADNKNVAEPKKPSAVVKYGLTGGKWVEHGSVEIPAELTGLTANDVNGAVTIYATSSGSNGKTGTLYRLSDVSGVNGTLNGIPLEIAKAPTNEAFRGVAFAPGTTIGSGGTPPPAPTIVAAESSLAAALEDPANPTLPITVADSGYSPNELTVTVASSKESVAPVSGISVEGSGSERTLKVKPAGIGISKLTLTVEAPNGVFTSTQINYGASAYQGDPSDRYYSGAADSGGSLELGGGYMLVAGDESNVLKLYRERTSGPPVKTFNFNANLPSGSTEVNLHSLARAGNTLYFVGSMANTNSGEAKPAHDIVFAATITGSGASTELTYLGSYTHLREDLTEWDEANGNRLGLAASAAPGQAGEGPSGFKIQGLEFLPGSGTEAYLSFRAPLEPTEGPEARTRALVIPVTNLPSLVSGTPEIKAKFGAPLEWNLGGLSIRQIRDNGAGEYLIVASTANSSDTSYKLYGWDGEPEDEPVLLNSIPLVEEGVWDTITSTPEPIANGNGAEVMQDDSKVVWYGPGTKDAEKGLVVGLQKSLGRLITITIPLPGTPNPPHLSQGATPNQGRFALRWKPAPTLRARFTLQHQNAEGGWKTVATGLSKREYTFGTGNPESEGTWTYRVKESNESGESEYSSESEAVKVDRTPPATPTASADRVPDFAGNGGWYKDTVTVTFTANGDPTLADGSPPSGVDASTLTGPEMFNTSGAHVASGTVADHAGNVSSAGTLTVQVDATPPSLTIECPATVLVGESGVTATVTASDAESGLHTDPSGAVPIDTTETGPQTVTRTAVDNVGHETTKSCMTQVVYPTPGAPTLTAGTSPNGNGLFTLGWSGDDPLQYQTLSYTLQHHNAATSSWSQVATGIGALSYAFEGAGEAEGTWVYRVQGSDPSHGQTTEYSPASNPVVVDETPPFPPSAKASRAPDYAGNGGWYKNSVEVNFSNFVDPNLSDGSPGSGIDPASIPSSQTITTSGSHNVCAKVADKVGNVSVPDCLIVQVEATPPSLEITCPATVLQRSSASATVTASDAYSGLQTDPSGTYTIDTSQPGEQTITRTAKSYIGFETTKSCTTKVEPSTPGAPELTAGSTPNNNGRFTLGWTGPDPEQYLGLSYTLQHHNAATATWSTAASKIGGLSYAFEGAGEAEGTWVYRVQGSDPSIGMTSEYSPTSSPVVVDRTPPNAPTANASRAPDYAGNGGWYKDSVSVSFTANGDPNLSDGSPGSGVEPASLTTPQTFSTSGAHTASGTIADDAGNVSAAGTLVVQVEATPPSLEIKCPAAVLQRSSANATVTAADAYSGLQTDPSGTYAIDTTQPGEQTITRTAKSYIGFETTKSCTTKVESSTPGAPELTAGSTPSKDGRFTLGWSGPDPLQYFGLSYTLQHHNAATATWSTVAKSVGERSYEFAGGGEEEGTWVYRVQGSDPNIGLTTEYSPASSPVVVDRTRPNTPTAQASRAPDYAGGGGWYKDSVTVSFGANGDPALADGSPGSGVDPTSLTTPQTFSTSGSHTASGTIADKAGNVSAAATLAVQVDATPPSVEVKCPATALVGEAGVSATVTASDADSGLAVNPSGTVPISTEHVGSVTVTRTAVDNVGHESTRSCTTKVLESPPEAGRCVKAPAEHLGSKTIYHGWFTTSLCITKASTQSSPYEWEPGSLKTALKTVIKPSTSVIFETVRKTRVTCLGETGTGAFTSSKTVGGVVMHFTECHTGPEEKCTTPGRPEGEIETKQLEGVLGIERIVSGKRYVALDLYPVGKKGAFLEYACGEHATTTLTGSVLGGVPADRLLSTVTVKYAESAGVQKPERFEGGEKDVLTNSHSEQVGLSASINLMNPEPLEINAYF